MTVKDASPISRATLGVPLTLTSGIERMFPTLTPAQIERIAAHGHVRQIRPGEVLVQPGDQIVPFFVVTSGGVEIVRPSSANETLVALYGPGQFTGEVNMLSGRPALAPSARQRVGRSDRSGSRTIAGARADRQRAQRDHHAGLHPAQGGVDRARARRCRAPRVESLLGNAPRQRVPDAQRPSVLVHRSRS